MRLTTRQKMVLARAVQRPVVGARRLAGRGPTLQARRGGVRWAIDLREGIDFAIWLRGCFEPSTVACYRRLLSPGATVLDIGANIGAHTLHLAEAVGPSGRVIAFEPTDAAYRRLLANIRLNPELEPRIDALQTMLLASDDAALPGEVLSSWPLLPRQALAAIPGRVQSTSGAQSRSLDSVVAERAPRSIELIKLDVDGYEIDVLDGATQVLSEQRPVIVAELAPFVYDDNGRDIRELLDRFDASGYELWSFKQRRVEADDIARLERQRASMNVVARPAPR